MSGHTFFWFVFGGNQHTPDGVGGFSIHLDHRFTNGAIPWPPGCKGGRCYQQEVSCNLGLGVNLLPADGAFLLTCCLPLIYCFTL